MLDNVTKVIHAPRIGAITAKLLQQSSSLKCIKLADKSFRGKFILWGNPEDKDFSDAVYAATGLKLPRQSGEVTDAGPYRAIWANPKRWYLICEQENETALSEALAASGQVHMSVTDGQCCFHLQGNHAVDLLKKGCSLNFSEAHFAPDQCLQTRLAITKAFLHRRSTNSFDIYVERSYSEYIWGWLLDAAKEFNN
ncbi:MAG: sarcosine oxidase subunit gamma family protein [Amphritea sp.]